MLTLAVTSSTALVGVAIGTIDPTTETVEVLTSASVETDRRHAEELTPLIVSCLAAVGAAPTDVERYVADIGPGRFTGLRVGLATVRTLALATGRPVVAVTSLETLAAAEAGEPVLAVIDARRAEVFQQPFAADGSPMAVAVVGDPAALDDPAPGMVVVGDGADRYADRYGAAVRSGRQPDAEVMLRLAAGREALPGPEVQPLYLRDPDVNVNVKTRHTPR
ncbi:MAG: tRNA (adenosine(37)-N6)-threonylcarbamoyltransferase complex dimerization subunit type 1 TsaB [Actinomycetota bacterium]